MKRFPLRVLIPLFILVALAGVFMKGLWLDPKKLPSTRLGQVAPAFELPDLFDNNTTHQPNDLKGQVWLLNVFASWCGACVAEHEQWMAMRQQSPVSVVGLAYKDAQADTQRWLADRGNPYRWVAVDRDGVVGIDYGVYGVPETFVIDAQGVIRYRHVGPVNAQFFKEHVMPLMQTRGAP